jgi:hypothetical protein
MEGQMIAFLISLLIIVSLHELAHLLQPAGLDRIESERRADNFALENLESTLSSIKHNQTKDTTDKKAKQKARWQAWYLKNKNKIKIYNYNRNHTEV